jgi:hypothetical protein
MRQTLRALLVVVMVTLSSAVLQETDLKAEVKRLQARIQELEALSFNSPKNAIAPQQAIIGQAQGDTNIAQQANSIC